KTKCSVLYLSRLHLDDLSLDHLTDSKRQQIQQLHLTYNRLSFLPPSVCFLFNLEYLDISNNALTVIPDDIMRLTNLKTFVAKNNLLDESSFPKEFERMQVETLNLSGNRFEDIPMQFLKMTTLQSLSLGGNRLKNIPAEIENLTRYEFVPFLRGNPLVVRFIKDMTYDPPSLMELAGRTIKSQNLPFSSCDLPSNLIHYLNLASECPNPKCAGIFWVQYQLPQLMRFVV
uniref:Leucine-rich repeat protein SHOC-2 n=1 Tax=Sinocyclocheilus grahami TaxID=75366 RepID=A0A672KCN0_SINGR